MGLPDATPRRDATHCNLVFFLGHWAVVHFLHHQEIRRDYFYDHDDGPADVEHGLVVLDLCAPHGVAELCGGLDLFCDDWGEDSSEF